MSNANLSGLASWPDKPNVQSISCSHNQITDLDLYHHEPTLTQLDCSHNLITRLDVPDNVISLNIHSNPLTRLIFNPESQFNQDINNMFQTPDNKPCLTWLFLGDVFNCKITKLPSTLEHLGLGDNYSHPLGQVLLSCSNLKSLNIGSQYNHALSGLLPLSLQYLRFAFDSVFNIPLNLSNLTNLLVLELGEQFDQDLNNLPDTLEELVFAKRSRFNRKFQSFPPNLLQLVLPDNYSRKLSQLPPRLIKISLGIEFTHPIDLFPDSLREIRFDSNGKFAYPIYRIPKSLLVLELPKSYQPKKLVKCDTSQLMHLI